MLLTLLTGLGICVRPDDLVSKITTSRMPVPTTLLSLPIEIRLQIYQHVLSTSNVHSFRPHRKVGWNRPHADLTNPALLFESDAPASLKQLFHSKLTKGDHAVILKTVLHHAKIMIVDHADFTALLKVASLPLGSNSPPGSGAQTGRSLAAVVRDNLHTIDFSDRMDEIVCQPNDIVKLIRGLPGLRTVHLMSKHMQRYSGTIDEHVDFTMERTNRELRARTETSNGVPVDMVVLESRRLNAAASTNRRIEDSTTELRRLTLRSPMTDGTRMTISPAMFERSLPAGVGTGRSTAANTGHATWVVVDLSMIVWQHFLYTGPPYRDHWRTIRMSTLLDVAEKENVHVVMNFRTVEFDPARTGNPASYGSPAQAQTHHGAHRPWTPSRRRSQWDIGGVFKGEMSTSDWVLRLRQPGIGVGALEYAMRQRRTFDELVSQDGCGLIRCRHSRKRRPSVCKECCVTFEG